MSMHECALEARIHDGKTPIFPAYKTPTFSGFGLSKRGRGLIRRQSKYYICVCISFLKLSGPLKSRDLICGEFLYAGKYDNKEALAPDKCA
jgi:hypothetical protein